MISNRCQVITCRSRCPVITFLVISTIDITIVYHNTRKQYRYRGSIRIQENDTVLKNSINTCFKLFTTIKIRIIVELSSGQVRKQHPSEAKQY